MLTNYKEILPEELYRYYLHEILQDNIAEEGRKYHHAMFFWDEFQAEYHSHLDSVINSPGRDVLIEFEYINFLRSKYFHLQKDEFEVLVKRNIYAAKQYMDSLLFLITSKTSIKKSEYNTSPNFNHDADIELINDTMKEPGVIDFFKALSILPFGLEFENIHRSFFEGEKYYLFSKDYFKNLTRFMLLNYNILLKEIFNLDDEVEVEEDFLLLLRDHVKKKQMDHEFKCNIYGKFKHALSEGAFIKKFDENNNLYDEFQSGIGATAWFFRDGDYKHWTEMRTHIRSKKSILPKDIRNVYPNEPPKEYLPFRIKYYPEISQE